MTEFFHSYKSLKGTLLRTIIFSIGHFFIAATCVMIFTGATFVEAATTAVVEPIINAGWYFLLDRIWTAKNAKN